MSVKTTAIVQGIVSRISERSGEKDGKKWSMTNVVIIGDDTLADCVLARGVAVPSFGEFVTARIEVGVFNADDNVTLVEYVEVVGKSAK